MDVQLPQTLSSKLKRFLDKAYRNAVVRANIVHGIAHQIRVIRKQRGWSQERLAKAIGAKQQSTIARLEDPSYGRYSLSTLTKIAEAYDVALLVKFVPYSKLLLEETRDLSPRSLQVESFENEYPKLEELCNSPTFYRLSKTATATIPVIVIQQSDLAGKDTHYLPWNKITEQLLEMTNNLPSLNYSYSIRS